MDLFYEAFKLASRPGKSLYSLSTPFANIQPYTERIFETLQLARECGELSQGTTICKLCDGAISLLPNERNAEKLRLLRLLKNVRRETQHYLTQHLSCNGLTHDNYRIRDTNVLPITPKLTTFVEAQAKPKPEKKKKN